MIYENIRTIIKSNLLIERKSIQDVLDYKVHSFQDLVSLYIKLSGYLVDRGYSSIDVEPVVRNDVGEKVIMQRYFEKNEIDKLILSKGSLIMNENIMLNVLEKCVKILEKYLEQFVIENGPQWKYFLEFQRGNFSGLKYVFRESVLENVYLFVYKDINGKDVKVTDRKDYLKFKKPDCELIYKSFVFPDEISGKLLRLQDLNFNSWKKHLLEGVEILYRGDDIYNNGEYLFSLDNDLEKFEKKNK